jgi:ribosomal protein S18 acetylase RimI-like enzyme
MTIALRPVDSADEPFLYDLYASTRAAELAVVDWSDQQKAAFLRQQFEAQTAHYRQHYPAARRDVILVDRQPAGRLYVDRWPNELRVIDIAILPRFRGRGVGSTLLRQLQAEAAASDRAVSLHVERFNPAQDLYTRLGFVRADDAGPVYLLMRWTSGPAPGAT